MSTITFTPEQLDAMLADPATRKVLESSPATRTLVLDWAKAAEERKAAFRKAAPKQTYTLGGESVTWRELVQTALLLVSASGKEYDKAPMPIRKLVDECKQQIGILYPASSKFQGLKELLELK